MSKDEAPVETAVLKNLRPRRVPWSGMVILLVAAVALWGAHDHRLSFWECALLGASGGVLLPARIIWAAGADGSADASAQVVHLHLACGVKVARDRAVAALWALSARPVRVVELGVLVLRTAVSWRNVGDVLRVELRAAGEGTDVTLQTGPWIRTQFYDLGRGEFNLDVLTRHLQAAPPLS